MKLPSASELPRVIICPTSAVLPRVDTAGPNASFGRAAHAYLADLTSMSREEALGRVPSDVLVFCESLDTNRLPEPKGAHPEVSFAWDVETGRVQRLGTNRDYEGSDRSRCLVGTLDLMRIENGKVIVSDYKTGFQSRAPAAHDAQLWFAVLVAARHYDVGEVVGEIIHLPFGGSRPVYDRATFDALAIDTIEVEFRRAVARVRAMESQPGIRPVVQGQHCQYCPALPHCPATKAMLLSPQDVDLADRWAGAITPENAANAYRNLQVLKRVCGRVQSVLEAIAAQGPIPLGDGVFYGPHEVRQQVIDGAKAFEVLTKGFGEDVARAACTMETSATAIERAVKPLAKGAGVTIKGLKESAINAISQAGGVSEVVKVRREEFKR